MERWAIYAILAALCWGLSYAASGPVFRSGMSPLTFYFNYVLFGAVAALITLVIGGLFTSMVTQVRAVGPNLGWFFLSLGAASLGAFLTYVAIGEKNATLASLIEISYPFFVVLFSWIFFRDMQLNLMTFFGSLLLISGITVIVIGSR